MCLGNYIGGDGHINYLYKEKYAFKIGGSAFIRGAASKPNDFSSGFLGIFTFGTSGPTDIMVNIQACVGRVYKLNSRGTVRANLLVGIGYTLISEPTNYQVVNEPGIGPNYTWDYGDYTTLSLIINPKIEFPFTQIWGLSFSPLLQINKDRFFVGVGIGQILGVLRKRNIRQTNKFKRPY